jgi:cysteinyl-tRNA synthetase
VNGKKMSKSDGTFYTLDDILEKGYSAAALRYALLAGHPRKQLNFTLDSLHAAEKAIKTLRNYRESLPTSGGDPEVFADAFKALHDDLNTPGALGAIFTIINRGTDGVDQAAFDRIIYAFGLDISETASPEITIPEDITTLAEKRWAAKQSKDWAAADALRAELTAAGWSMLDRKDGYSLEPLNK